MIRHLIVVFTRMYAQKGSDEDEFVNIWDVEHDQGKQNLTYHSGNGETRSSYMLVVHSYRCESGEHDGFSLDGPDERSLEQARGSIIEGIKLLKPPVTFKELEVGIAFHPDWDDDCVKLFSETMKEFLKEQEARVSFVKRYSGATSLFPPLVAKLHNSQDFAKEYHRVWTYFVEDIEAYVVYLGALLQQVFSLLEPLNTDLEGWRASDFKVSYQQEIVGRSANSLPMRLLDTARDLVMGGTSNTDSVRKLVKEMETKLKKSQPALAQEIENCMQKVEEAFNEANLSPAATLLELLGKVRQPQNTPEDGTNPQQETLEAAKDFEKLRSLLEKRNEFGEWYVALRSSLEAMLRITKEGFDKSQVAEIEYRDSARLPED